MTGRARARTGDRGPPKGSPEIFTVEQIGPKRARTPNGNLVCFDVPISRVGMLMYKEGEIPLKADRFGVIRVHRTADELFRPETIGSFMGVAVTNEHPESMEVTPKTWKKEAYGFSTTNVRRGEGDDEDVLLADLIITDAKLIKLIDEGKVEVSAGYEADYEQTGEGEGIQTNIIGNHIALVERGRCGPRCAIGDHDSFRKGKEMTIRKRLTTETRQVLRQLIGDAESLLETETDPPNDGGVGEGNDGATHVHIHMGGSGGAQPGMQTVDDGTMQGTEQPGAMPGATPGAVPGQTMDTDARIGALEQGFAELKAMIQQLVGGGQQGGDEDPGPDDFDETPTDGEGEGSEGGEEGEDFPTKDELPEDLNITAKKTGDEVAEEQTFTAKKTGDSAAFSRSYQQLLADVEVLVPGMKVPTFDHKAPRTKTVDRMCSIRRAALTRYATTDTGAALLGAVGSQLATLKCGAIATAFGTAASAQRVLNNRSATGDASSVAQTPTEVRTGPMSIDQINKLNAEFYAKSVARG